MRVATRQTREVGRELPALRRVQRRGGHLLPAYTLLLILYLSTPILLMILYGFNDIQGERQVPQFEGFTLDWYRNLFAITGLTDALKNSLIIAFGSTAVSTVLGTLLGLALGRYRFQGQGATNFVIFLAIASPEVVLGASLAGMFVLLQFPFGVGSILLAHIGFQISFVGVVVRARVQGLDRSLEDAAQDLFARPLATFFRVTLPLIWPGILAGALLAFALSLDDFIITDFTSGQTQTFPIWVFGSTRIGMPPQVNVMGTLIFAFGLLLALLTVFLQRKERG